VLADKQLEFNTQKDVVATGKELSERYLKAGDELEKGMIVNVSHKQELIISQS
jgi:hypothetical protein